MSKLAKGIIQFVVGVAAIVIAFLTHWLAGVGAIALIAVYLFYRNRAAFLAMRANMEYQRGNEGKALQLLDRVSKMKGVHPRHLNNYGYLLLKDGKLEQARQVLEISFGRSRQREDLMLAKINLANVHWLQDNRDKALELLEEVYADFKTTTVYGNYGYLKLLGGRPEDALALNLEAYEYNSDDKTITDNLAQNYYMLGRLEEAEELYAKVMTMSPKYLESHYYYAQTLRGLGKREEARGQIAIALEKEPALVPSVSKADVEKLAAELGAE